ncbi:ATP-binding cassette domain-containing protein [Micrococcoides hystricis]|uniref:ATP-binding cassette domain-containing protein n=1 Tax=Micrococcoides hystricis TaxID=1572761 RepID=A0ABV6PCX5_9MICC
MLHVRLLRLWGRRRWALGALIIVGLLIAGSWIWQALLLSEIFAELAVGRAWDAVQLVPLIMVLAAVLLLRPLLVVGRQLLSQWAMTLIKSELRSAALVAYIRRSATDPAGGNSGRDHAQLVDGVENLDGYLSGYLPQLGVTVAVVSVVGTTMIVFDPVTGAVALCLALLLPFLPRLWDKVLAARGQDHWGAYAQLQAEFVDSMQGMTTLVSFGADQRRERQLADASENLLRRTLRQLRISLIESGLNGFALAAVPAVVLVVVASRRADLDAFTAFALVLLSIELVRPFKDLAAQWHAGYLGTFSGPGIVELIEQDSVDRKVAADSEEPDAAPHQVGEVALEQVTAYHPRTEHAALADITLQLRPGLTAVVGESGSGKSTLAAVLTGLINPAQGQVRVNDEAIDAAERLKAVALVAQDPVLAAGTIADNIGAGQRTKNPDLIHASAQLMGIGTEESTLELQSPVGEGGALLSGGQRQRVALARGLAQDRPIVVIDEATSALDTASEALIMQRIRQACQDKILLAITHRLAVANNADWVVVMADGNIVEQGQPEQLLADPNSAFAALAAQNQGALS